MEILKKIKNKTDFGLALAFFISILIIPTVSIPFEGKLSYLSFSDYSLILGVLTLVFIYFSAVSENNFHSKILKWSISAIWAIFLFELVKALSNFRDMFGDYNIFSILELGAYISLVLLIIITIRTIKSKKVELIKK